VRTLVAFLPDSMMVIVIMIIGICLIVGAVSRRKAIQWLRYVVLLAVTAPFYDIIINLLPFWLLVVLLVIGAWMLFRFIAETLLGRESAAYMIGILAAVAARGVFRLFLVAAAMPLRLLLYAFRVGR
jgi:hypothetical protein